MAVISHECHGVSDHWPLECLFNSFFRNNIEKTSLLDDEKSTGNKIKRRVINAESLFLSWKGKFVLTYTHDMQEGKFLIWLSLQTKYQFGNIKFSYYLIVITNGHGFYICFHLLPTISISFVFCVLQPDSNRNTLVICCIQCMPTNKNVYAHLFSTRASRKLNKKIYMFYQSTRTLWM